MISRIWLAVVLSHLATNHPLGCEAADEQAPPPPLPSVWGLSSPSQRTSTFRIMSEIRLADNGRSFVVEEWADGEAKHFRLDAIPMEGDKQPGRRTLLINGNRPERYIYEPFKCSPLADEMLGKMALTQLFPHGHEFVVAGLGSIWLYALARARNVTFEAAQTEPKRQAGKRSLTMGQVLSGYHKFATDGDSEFPFRIELFFHANGWSRDDRAIDPETLVAIHLVDQQTSSIKLAAKIVEINTQVRAAAKVMKQPELFELPLGYGCIRAAEPKMIAENRDLLSYKPPEDCYAPAGDGRARVCNIEVVSSLAANQDDDMDKWKTYTSSLRFSSGKVADRAYIIQERREFARAQQVNTCAPSSALAWRPVVERTKRIWALEKNACDENGKGLSESEQIFFQLANRMQDCESVRAARLNEVPAIEMPFALPPSELSARNASSGDLHSKLIGGPSLDPGMMRELFISTDGYHLIRANLAPWVKYRDVIQEKRLDKFELRGRADEQVIWAGPVSIVRRYFVDSKPLEPTDETQQAAPADALDIHVDLFLFSKERDQILARIHLRLSPAKPVDGAYLHRELDITPCFLSFGKWNGDSELALAARPSLGPHSKPKGSLSFVVTYSLDLDDETAELLVRQEEQVYMKFVNNLVALSGQKLDPLQLNDVEVDIEYDRIKVSGTLLRWPELFSFTKRPKIRISRAAKRTLLLASELKGSEVDCAASCSHIGCSSFSYCSQSKICDLSAAEPSQLAHQLELVSGDESCALWTRRDASGGALDHAQPAQLFERMRSKILSASGDDDVQSPVAISIDLGAQAKSRTLLLIPSAINAQDNRLEDNPVLANDRGPVAGPYELAADDPLDQSAEFVRVEFEVLFEGRKLVRAQSDQEAFPFEEATHMNYEDCERFCRENDCKSFSHCRLEETCLISHLEQTKSIELNSERDDFCYSLARMPLSKFHKLAGLAPPNDADAPQLEANQSAAALTRRYQTGSNRDCAIQCLDQTDNDFVCKAFYFCTGNTDDCILTTDRLPPVEIDDFMEPKTSVPGAAELTCDLYQRSDLVEFNRLAGKEMDPEMIKARVGSALSLLLELDADACASECTHATTKCIAFHVCSHIDHVKGVHQLHCAILTNENNSSEPSLSLRRELLDAKLLREAKMCTTFVAKIQMLGRAPLRQAPHSSDSDEPDQGSASNSILNALLVLIGIAIGYALTWFVVIRNPRLLGAILPSRL